MIYLTSCEHANKYTTEMIPCHTLSPLNIKGNHPFTRLTSKVIWWKSCWLTVFVLSKCKHTSRSTCTGWKTDNKDFRPYPFNFFLFV